MKKNFIRYLIIFFISVIFTFYLFEFYLLNKENNLFLSKEKKIKKFERSSRMEVYKRLKSIENVAVSTNPLLFTNFNDLTLLPLSGVSSIKTILCNENGYMSYYFSDRYGFNNPDNEWKQIEENKRDESGGININPHSLKKNQKDYNWDVEYVLLGDSFTHGACVNRPNDIGSVLRNLSKKTVLNLGYGGNGPLIEYATFREYVNFTARNVLFFFYENDLYDLKKELENKILANYLNDKSFSQNLKKKQTEINSISFFRIEKVFNQREQSFFEKLNNRYYHQKKFQTTKNKYLKFIRLHRTKNFLKGIYNVATNNINLPYKEFNFIINDLNDRVIASGGKFYLILLPSYERYSNNDKLNLYHSNIIKKKIIFILKKQNIEIIDIHEDIFKKFHDPTLLFNFSKIHYNEKGYELIAKQIYKKTKGSR